MKIHASSRPSTVAIAAGVLVLLLAGCARELPKEISIIQSAMPVAADGSAMPSVTLPHQRRQSDESGNIVAYRVSLPPQAHPRGLGLFVTISDVPIAVFANGVPVFQNGDRESTPIQASSWRASPTFRIAPSLLRPDTNELVINVYDQRGSFRVLGPIYVGEPVVLERWAMREGLLHHLAPLLVGAALIGAGAIALSLWRGRSDSTLFLLLAAGTILWGVQSIIVQLPSPILPQPHRSVLLISMYIWFPMLLAVFFMRFSLINWRIYEIGAAALALLAAPALYAGRYLGQATLVSATLRAAALVWISVALWAVLRYAWRERSFKSALLLLAGAVCVVFAVRDWVVTVFGDEVRVVLLTSYSGLALVLLAGWMLIDRYHKAYATAEAVNVELESRVKRANAALARQLEEVRAARDDAEQASLAKSRFFAAASHDLRQPLHSLGFFAAALRQHATSAEARDLVAHIADSIAALEGLFNELLDLSKLDAGAVGVRRRNVSIQALFDRLSLEFHAQAVERELRMRFVPTRLAAYTDPILLERILVNLVSNALRYTRQGGVIVGARRRGELISLVVIDSGIGIAPEQQSQIFDEFYQIGNPGRDRRRGLGLGLAIVRRLTTLLGHELVLRSAPGQGTRFRLMLPRAYGAAEALTGNIDDQRIETFAGRRVLMVDDDPEIRLATSSLLSQWGLDVRAAAGSQEVETLLGSGFVPELAIVDLRLDALDDGIDLIDQLRTRLPDLPALLLSGDTGAPELERVRASGVPLMTKPVSPARLRSALHFALAV